MRPLLAVIVIVATVTGTRAEPLFLNILPAGQDGLTPVAPPPQPRPDHHTDQLALYRDLIPAAPLAAESDLVRFFKVATIDTPATPERVETPRAGVTISRDGFGVPHVVGATRGDVYFGAGYATAEDRLFLADALRHIGRGRFTQFAGGLACALGAFGMDNTYAHVAGYSEDELQAQIDNALARNPDLGPQVLADATEFVAGVNAYIAEARLDPTKKPLEYTALNIPLDDWKVTDVVAATVSFITVIGFGNGGGGEHQNALLLQALQSRFGARKGGLLFQDLRSAEDPEAPVTTRKRFPYLEPKPGQVKRDAIALIDPGSFVAANPLPAAETACQPASTAHFPHAMSNWLAVTGAKAEGGVPILVGGPQTGYFAPQDLLELSLEGGGVNVRGAAVPGTPYVVLGHTPEYAFTATSGGSDLADVRVEKVCTPAGGAENSGTLFNGACQPLYRRVDTWSAGSLTITSTLERTVHGPVIGRATVNGAPVVLAVQRSSFNREVESGVAFAQLDADVATSPDTFRSVMGAVGATLNWGWVSRTDFAYFHSGLYPVRAKGVDPDLPSWGTGEWEWRGFLPPTAQPFDVNPRQGFATSWNNKPARKWRAADDQYGYGPVYRNLALETRLAAAVKKGPVAPTDVVDAMADAATVDLRGQTVAPFALLLAEGDPSLANAVALLDGWVRNGAHRRDRDGDGCYDENSAVSLMDEWYPRLLHAVFDPQLADFYGQIPLGFDDAPSNSNLGSAYQGGWYGYLSKVLRQAAGRRVRGRYHVLRCAGGSRKACATAVRKSLSDAVAAVAASNESCQDHTSRDDIHYSIGGLLNVPNQPWQNRPTFQQVVQIRQ
jgi:hypothetical protein